MECKKSKDLRPQCNLCNSKESIYKLKGDTNIVISICKKCLDKILTTVKDLKECN